MRNILHLFSREVVAQFLEAGEAGSKQSNNFEFMAALLMQRLYEDQWESPTMIGFYFFYGVL